jgi:dihydropteroate synthase
MRKRYSIPLPRGGTLYLGGRTLVMGVLNVTPDSFSDGGRFADRDRAVAHALALAEAGADILDVGGESTRPGSSPVPEAEELARVIPVLERLAGRIRVPVSIDTHKASVARAAVAVGAEIINDIRGLADPDMAAVAAETRAALVLMHCPVAPAEMAGHTDYPGGVLAAVIGHLREALARAEAAGVSRDAVLIDAGIGFAKTAGQSAELIDRTAELAAALDRPVLVGPSRKSFIGRVLDRPADGRLWGTAAAVAHSIARGAHVVRVHDVAEMVQVARVCDFLNRGYH